MEPLIECVPNISQGRDVGVIDLLWGAVAGIPGCRALHRDADPDHNRTVFTLAGTPAGMETAAAALVRAAAGLIDLTRHRGVHPRMGAVDVVPFVPLKGATMADCAALARRAGARIWREAGVPVFLYEQAASAPHRQNLADIRRGGFEGLFDKVNTPGWTPDFGGAFAHPTAGATAVGARPPLLAFNLTLDTADADVARRIARAIRQRDGGLPGVKALGLYLASRGRAQVSCNLVDIDAAPPLLVLRAAEREAARLGAGVEDTEIVGLTLRRALPDDAVHVLRLRGFDPTVQVLDDLLGLAL
ncbi:MAG: glutamate formimidoyltransferase [Oscillospiraceae bacterium]|jgi:glutamate formiminotransferase|nr:glutamate formimidoyltransferase [Oscillospiraceae bacterium]